MIERQCGESVLLEIVLVTFDLLLLAIHEIDVVAKEQVEVLLPAPRQAQPDRVELEEQIVAEGANQRQARVLFVPKFFDQSPQDRESRGLLAALLLREQLGQRFQPAYQRTPTRLQRLPVWVAGKSRVQHLG